VFLLLGDSSYPFEKIEPLLYKYAPMLIVIDPEATTNLLLAKQTSYDLNLTALLPAFMTYSQDKKRNGMYTVLLY
jgi:hypothetical protein